MKKSELLALLKQDIQDAADDLDLQARMVLARCISVGMLPPEAADFNIGNNWEPEEPYGKSIVEEVNTDIKRINDIAISSVHTLTLKKLLTAKEELSIIE